MDSLFFNKIAGATLSSLLVIVGMKTFVDILYPKGDENTGKAQIVVTQNPVGTPTQTAEAAKPEEQGPPVGVLMASANPDTGQTAMKQCAQCHNWEKGGANKVGPALYGVVGRPIGKQEGFRYSGALSGKGGNWTPEELYGFLKNPKAWVPGTTMAFAGVKNPQDIANIIAYLNKQSDTPQQLTQK